MSKALTLTTKGEKKLTQSTKVAGFRVANFAVLYRFGAQAVIHGMSLQAISEGSELSPKVNHEDVSNAMTLTPQQALLRCIDHREIFHDEMLALFRQIMGGEIRESNSYQENHNFLCYHYTNFTI